MTEDAVIPADTTVTLDLNGHTITNQADHTIHNYGNLTIEGEGTIDNVSHGRAAVYNEQGASALLKGGSVCSLTNTPNEIFVYDRTFKGSDVLPKDSKCVLFGHTPIRNLTGRDEILLYRRNGLLGGSTYIKDYAKIHIDTGVYLSGTLGCICLDTCQCFYVKGVK